VKEEDSAMARHSLLRDPAFEVATLLTTVTEGYERTSMHGVRRELLWQQAASIGLPLQEARIPPQCPNSVYESRMARTALRYRRRGILHVGFGDIFLRDLRAYRERNLARAGMFALFPLWDVGTRELAARFLTNGFRARSTCIDPRKLHRSFAGRELDVAFFRELPTRADPCRENGEFYSFVFHHWPGRERDSFVFCDLLPDSQGEDLSAVE
jgi:diphthamide synthase (EF-2-diphthine--ammonia ligase)